MFLCYLVENNIFSCNLTIFFVQDANRKINFGMRLTLISDATWVSCASYLDLCNLSRAFTVRIDGSKLQPGVYNSTIKAYDTACIEKGHIFHINITLVQPHVFPEKEVNYQLAWKDQFFPSNSLKRHFVLVPELATYASKCL